MTVGFFDGSTVTMSMEVPDDRWDWLVPVPSRVQLGMYLDDWYPRHSPAYETKRYSRIRYWWNTDPRWEGSCFVLDGVNPRLLEPTLWMIAWLCGIATWDRLKLAYAAQHSEVLVAEIERRRP